MSNALSAAGALWFPSLSPMSRLSGWSNAGPVEQQGSAQHTQQEAKVFDNGLMGGPPGFGGGTFFTGGNNNSSSTSGGILTSPAIVTPAVQGKRASKTGNAPPTTGGASAASAAVGAAPVTVRKADKGKGGAGAAPPSASAFAGPTPAVQGKRASKTEPSAKKPSPAKPVGFLQSPVSD